MLRQPLFGQRLRALRLDRRLSQTALAGDGLSAGYLSRLESGLRPPTANVVAYLSGRLGVPASEFYEQGHADGSRLTLALVAATSSGSEEAIAALADAGARDPANDPLIRLQALWMLADLARRQGDRDVERAYLAELTGIGDALGLPEVSSRGRTLLARCLRSLGDIPAAREAAEEALAIAERSGLGVPDQARALAAVVSVEAEEGRLDDARVRADRLYELVADAGEVVRAEAFWSAATVHVRSGGYEPAASLLERALGTLDSHTDLMLWMRLRLAAASLYLQFMPPRTEPARVALREAEIPVRLIGSGLYQQEYWALQARLAFIDGRITCARACYERVRESGLQLAHRDQARLHLLHGQLLIAEGQVAAGVGYLRELAAGTAGPRDRDLAAEIWRAIAEALAARQDDAR